MSEDLVLVRTCYACPEQYDLNINNENIGYLRLRHGRFYAEHVPSGEIVYTANPEGDGIFVDSERDQYLEAATEAILQRHFLSKD